jgi:hypothetical protein
LIGLGLLAYEILMIVQSGSVGAAMGRWPVFGISLLAGIVVVIGYAIVSAIIVAAVTATLLIR